MSRFTPALNAADMEFDDEDENHAQRVPVVIMMDNSSSMRGEGIAQLNAALVDMREQLRHDVELSAKAEICLITFGHDGVTAWRGSQPAGPGVSPFVPASQFEVPELRAGGVTPLVEAVELGIRLVAEHKRNLRSRHLSYYRPVMWCVTDGRPTNGTGHPSDDWRRLPPIIAREEDDKRLVFFAVGVAEISPQGEEVLEALAPEAHLKLEGFQFSVVLQLVSASADSAAHGDPIEAIKKKVMAEFHQHVVRPV